MKGQRADRLFRRGRVWYTHVVDDHGERQQRSTRCTDEEAARLVDARLQRQAADPDRHARETTTIGDALGLLLENRRELARAGRRSAETVKCYEVKAGHWVRLFERDEAGKPRTFLLDWLTAGYVDGFISQRRAEDAAETTIHKELTVMRAALKLARRRGLWKGDPAEIMPIAFAAEYVPRERALTSEELQKLLPQLRRDQAARVAFAVATSANWGETERARREHIAADRSFVFLDGTKRRQRKRRVPVVTDWQRQLLKYSLERAAGVDGKMFGKWSNVRRDLRAACERAKIPPCSTNDLRRTCAKWLRASGAPPHLLAPVMGHADSRMVERVYGRLSGDELAELLVEHLEVKRGRDAASSPAGIAAELRAQAERLATEGGDPAEVRALLRAAARASQKTASPVQQIGPGILPGLAGLPGEETVRKPAEFVPRDGIEPPTRGFSNRAGGAAPASAPQPDCRVAWLLPAPRRERAASPVHQAPTRKRGAR